MSSPIYNGKKDWKKKEVIMFIQMIEAAPELWDTTCSDYKNRFKRAAALKRLAQVFKTTIYEIKRKIHNLRSQFNAELRRMKRKSEECGDEELPVHTEWRFFEHLKFLLPVYNANSDIEMKITQFPQSDLKADSSESEVSEDYQEEFNFTNEEEQKLNQMPKTEKVFITHVQNNHEQGTDRSVGTMSYNDNKLFGEYVCSELRNLSDRGAKKLKLLIRKAILEVTEEEFNQENNAEKDSL